MRVDSCTQRGENRLKLNNFSYCHRQIRLLCYEFETKTSLKLRTELSENFNDIRFSNEVSYVIIDFRKENWRIMSYKLQAEEWQILQDIMLYCVWLYIGEKWMSNLSKKQNKQKRKKAA